MNHTPEQTDPTPVAVEQVDRDAAAQSAVLVEMRDLIRAGRADDHAEPWAAHRLLGIEQGRAEMRDEALAHVVTTRTRPEHGKHCCCVTCELNEAEDGIRAIPTAKERPDAG